MLVNWGYREVLGLVFAGRGPIVPFGAVEQALNVAKEGAVAVRGLRGGVGFL